MRDFIIGLAEHVFNEINNCSGVLKKRNVNGYSPGGDAQFDIDKLAERAVLQFIEESNQPVALFTEDAGLKVFGNKPRHVLIVDPIDGTRPSAAGFEMSCISIAAAPYSSNAKIKDVEYALLKELKSGAYIYGDIYHNELFFKGYKGNLPNLSKVTDLKNMFWSIEFNGHPSELMIKAYGHLIDCSANTGGIFVFNSASYSISRIITGQLDAYVDIGNRLLKDNNTLLPKFQEVGNGNVLHLFPYDIAASVFLAKKAGVTITDAYGMPLEDTLLMDLSYKNQQSCIAASTKELHSKLLNEIKWDVI